MADLDYAPRTFPGDPAPPPKAPAPAKVATAGTQAPASAEGAASVALPEAEDVIEGPKTSFRVVDMGNTREIYAQTDDLETHSLGPVSIADDAAADLLNSRSVFDPASRSWDVTEDVVAELRSGDLSFDQYVSARYKKDKAMIARGLIFDNWLGGKTSLEDALARGEVETLKMQVKDAPMFVWQGDVVKTVAKMWADARDAGVRGVGRRVAGETAGQVAQLTDAPAATAFFMGVAVPLVASGGTAAPVLAPVAVGALRLGAGALVFDRSRRIEAGNAAAEMLEKGLDEETVKGAAPLVGVVNGALETLGFEMIPAPYRRALSRKILASEAVKGFLANAYTKYMSELGVEVATEVAQERMNVYVENLAADVDERPDLKVTEAEAYTRYGEAALASAAGAGGVKLVGLTVEKGAQRLDAKATKKAQVERAKTVEAALKPLPVEEVKAAAPVAESEAPTAAPVEGEAAVTAAETATPEAVAKEATSDIDEIVKFLNEDPAAADAIDTADRIEAALEKAEGPGPQTYGEKIIEAERKALVETRRRDLLANQQQIKEKQAEVLRLERKGMGTKVAERQLETLVAKNADLRADIEFHTNIGPRNLMIEPEETLSLKPATLESVAALGLKEGRREVLGERRNEILEIAERLEFSQADLRAVLKDKNYGTMGDVEFKNWIKDKFTPAAKQRFIRKVGQRDVRRMQAEKSLESERNVRLQAKLPSVDKMTNQQLFDYVDLLSTFDRGDKVLSPKRQRALETTGFAGARTMGEVAAKVRELYRFPINTMTRLLPESGFVGDLRRGLATLAKRSPMHNAMVQTVEAATEREDIAYMAFREKLHELGAKALASRKSIFGRTINPTMPEVFAHLEADDAKVAAGEVQLPVLTPEEQQFVEFVEEAYGKAYEYLVAVDGLKSRFTGTKGYITHVRRSLVEAIADIKDTGWKEFFKELKARWVPQEENFRVVSRTGGSIGLRAHMKQSVFRTDELTPTKNVIRAVDTYFKALSKKKALDRAVPQVDTMVDALKWLDGDKSVEAEGRRAAFEKFVGQYLSMKKGQTHFADWAPHGGFFDLLARTMTTLPSLAWIAFNPKLQAAAGVGELMATIPVVGVEGLARAVALSFSKDARQFLDNNKGFTGETLWDRFTEPGKDLSETGGMLMYGLLQEWRVRALQVILLAEATSAEIKAGAIAPERLAEIKTHAARWMDVKGSKSVLGATSAGAMLTQFKGWAIPIFETTIEDLTALSKQMAGGEKMTPVQQRELIRLTYTFVAVTAISALVAETVEDEEDDSPAAQWIRALHREMFTITGGAGIFTVFSTPPAIAYAIRLVAAAKMWWEGARYKTGDREGEKKWPTAAARLLPGRSLLTQIGVMEAPKARNKGD